MTDFIIKDPLEEIDPVVNKIIALEGERQVNKLIFIPSESRAPDAILTSLGSHLQNIYAEGYPDEATRQFTEDQICDVDQQITHFRRFSDPRYYKGVEFADILEELARRRCAEAFSNKKKSADEIYVNVQPLSGAPANNAVYHALLNPGDVIVGMNLFHGGHLTHGSSVNRSGKLYKVFHYSVDSETEKIDYQSLQKLVLEKKPKILISGYSSYPWVPDWKIFKEIADSVGAYFLADIAHIAGLIAAEVIPSPIGYADIVTFTTHKTLCGPRGACILSFDQSISKKIDKAVFPGEQGGPHIQVFGGIATAFKLAKTDRFQAFQAQIIKNCKALNDQLEARGFRIAFGGTNTHLTNFDCKSIVGEDGTALSGDMAARILDIAGMVMNANTIPGDRSSRNASGIRLGTPWLTQRGLKEDDMVEMANIIADLLFDTEPYSIQGKTRKLTRAKVIFETMQDAKRRVSSLIKKTVNPDPAIHSGFPINYEFTHENNLDSDIITLRIEGDLIIDSLHWIFPDDLINADLKKPIHSALYVNENRVDAILEKLSSSNWLISIDRSHALETACWLQDLSDGFIRFDDDLLKRIPGPYSIKETSESHHHVIENTKPEITKPFFIGIENISGGKGEALPEFKWEQVQSSTTKRTVLYNNHKSLGAKIIPFAGWEMPIWYSSIKTEHHATRNDAGLFDVSHMGVFQAEGDTAVLFLDYVCTNDIAALGIGESCYTHFLDANADVIDDLLVYRHQTEKYLIVVNAANEEKDWDWLLSVKNGVVRIDNQRPWVSTPFNKLVLRNLHDQREGVEQKVDLALQGPNSLKILQKLNFSEFDLVKISNLKRTNLCQAKWHKQDLIISRTGYTGQNIGFEIFAHPDVLPELWDEILSVGKPLGLIPCGLGARDSLRVEAGLPLYGHEMGGSFNLGVSDAGFSNFVKTYKPWFIGRDQFIKKEKQRTHEVFRFRFEKMRTRMAHLGDPVFNNRGKHIGFVTSCAINSEGIFNGQAYIEKKYADLNSGIYIYQDSENIEPINIKTLAKGGKISLPEMARIEKRFLRF